MSCVIDGLRKAYFHLHPHQSMISTIHLLEKLKQVNINPSIKINGIPLMKFMPSHEYFERIKLLNVDYVQNGYDMSYGDVIMIAFCHLTRCNIHQNLAGHLIRIEYPQAVRTLHFSSDRRHFTFSNKKR